MADIQAGSPGEDNGSDRSSSTGGNVTRAARKRRLELRRMKVDPAVPCFSPLLPLKWAPLCTNGQFIPPKFGVTSICGRRRNMEDAVAIQPFFHVRGHPAAPGGFHYFAVYDGHGCAHVAMKCQDRLHEMVREELMMGLQSGLENDGWWKWVMDRSFARMDCEVGTWKADGEAEAAAARCLCDPDSPRRAIVGSAAVAAVITPKKIIVANCGDCRAVLYRGGRTIPLSFDHKSDRPDEKMRIEAAGGQVIYNQGARVCGILSMSRAIGDNYLKPYVSCEPEVSVTQRTDEDQFLILASDGIWEVMSNETACAITRQCLAGLIHHQRARPRPDDQGMGLNVTCNAAAVTLVKLALSKMTEDNMSVIVINLKNLSS